MVVDWPGGTGPTALEMIRALVEAGADVNARFVGGAHTETPLHWAASADDVEALDALLDAGADIEARGGVIGGGTALDDAWAFGQWRRGAAARGAGRAADVAGGGGVGVAAGAEGDVTQAFWAACHGGQRGFCRGAAGSGRRSVVGGVGRADAARAAGVAAVGRTLSRVELRRGLTVASRSTAAAVNAGQLPEACGNRCTTPGTLGGITIPNRVMLAPLAGIGNWFVRLQAKRYGAGLAVSEMISSFAIHYGNRKTLDELLVVHPDEGPVAIQLFGQDPEIMRSRRGARWRASAPTSSTSTWAARSRR